MSWTNITLISVNLIFGYLVFLKMNQNGRHLGLNRWFLIGFPVFSIALGLLYHYSNGSVLNGFSIDLPLIQTQASTSSNTIQNNIDWMYWAYASGVVISLSHFLWSLWKVRRPKGAKYLNQLGKQRIYLVANNYHSFSHLNNIYISEYELENIDFILKHELAHSRQNHSLDLLYIRLIRSFFWFHPVVYLWETKMKENHEYLADRDCVQSANDLKPYSYALLSAHLGVSIPDLASGFNRQSLLQKRIIQLKTQNTFNMKKVILIPALLVGVALMTSVQLTSNPSSEIVPSKEKVTSVKGDNETKPEFVGGMNALVKYMQENIKYPKNLASKKLEAKVFVKFVVSKSGKIKDVTVARGSEHEAFNEEAKRVVSKMPNWKPGVKDGKAVSAEMTLPIKFAIN